MNKFIKITSITGIYLTSINPSFSTATIKNLSGSQPNFPTSISQTQRGPINKNIYDFLIYTTGSNNGSPKTYSINIQTHSEFADNIKGPYLQLLGSTPGYANVPLEHQKLYFSAEYQPCDDGTSASPPPYSAITSNNAEYKINLNGEKFISQKACDPASGSIPGTLKLTLNKVDGFVPAAGNYQGQLQFTITDQNSDTSTLNLIINAKVNTIINVPDIRINNLGYITLTNKGQSNSIRDFNYNITSNSPNGIRITGISPYSDEIGAYISKPGISLPNINQRIHFLAEYEPCQGNTGLKALTKSKQTRVPISHTGFNHSYEKYCDDNYGFMPGYLKFTRLPISTGIPEAGTYSGQFTILAEAV